MKTHMQQFLSFLFLFQHIINVNKKKNGEGKEKFRWGTKQNRPLQMKDFVRSRKKMFPEQCWKAPNEIIRKRLPQR